VFFWLHSVLRYAILLAGAAVVLYGLVGVVSRKPFDPRMKKMGSLFAGLLHLEILVGVGLLFTGSFYPGLTGHLFMMIFAAVAAQIVPSVMRRRPPEERTWTPYVVGALVSLVLVAAGILALGRPVLGRWIGI
jgi:hypothetical protein